MSALEQAHACLQQAHGCIEAAAADRNNLLRLCIVLIDKLGNDVVVTNAELESIPPNKSIKQHDKTDLGFKVSTTLIAEAPDSDREN